MLVTNAKWIGHTLFGEKQGTERCLSAQKDMGAKDMAAKKEPGGFAGLATPPGK